MRRKNCPTERIRGEKNCPNERNRDEKKSSPEWGGVWRLYELLLGATKNCPKGFLESVVKWCPHILTFRFFFEIQPMSGDFRYFLLKIGEISNMAPKIKSGFLG